MQGAFVDLDNKKVRKIQAVYENCGRKATGWRFSVDAWGLFFFFEKRYTQQSAVCGKARGRLIGGVWLSVVFFLWLSKVFCIFFFYFHEENMAQPQKLRQNRGLTTDSIWNALPSKRVWVLFLVACEP